jgi:soluble lytic murein transglycosylase
VLQAQGGLSDALRWERIDAAADAQQPAVMRSAARGLPADLAQANITPPLSTSPMPAR